MQTAPRHFAHLDVVAVEGIDVEGKTGGHEEQDKLKDPASLARDAAGGTRLVDVSRALVGLARLAQSGAARPATAIARYDARGHGTPAVTDRSAALPLREVLKAHDDDLPQ